MSSSHKDKESKDVSPFVTDYERLKECESSVGFTFCLVMGSALPIPAVSCCVKPRLPASRPVGEGDEVIPVITAGCTRTLVSPERRQIIKSIHAQETERGVCLAELVVRVWHFRTALRVDAEFFNTEKRSPFSKIRGYECGHEALASMEWTFRCPAWEERDFASVTSIFGHIIDSSQRFSFYWEQRHLLWLDNREGLCRSAAKVGLIGNFTFPLQPHQKYYITQLAKT